MESRRQSPCLFQSHALLCGNCGVFGLLTYDDWEGVCVCVSLGARSVELIMIHIHILMYTNIEGGLVLFFATVPRRLRVLGDLCHDSKQ